MIVRLALMAACLLLSACEWVKDSGVEGNGVVVEKAFDIFDTSLLELDVPAHVTYMRADVPAMTVRLDENLMEYLTVTPDDHSRGLLQIASTRPLRNFKEFSIIISTPNLYYLVCSGSVKFETQDTIGFKPSVCMLRVNGSADVDIAGVEMGSLNLVTSGSAKVNIHSCNAPHLYLSATGSASSRRGKVEPIRVSLAGQAEQVKVSLVGPCEVDLTEMDYRLLDRTVVGRGSIKTNKPSYKSEPAQAAQSDPVSSI